MFDFKNNKNLKTLSLFEIFLILMSVVAFSCLVSWSLPEVKASQFLPTGCCLETDSGASCQEMLMSDSDLCSEGLIGTSCNEVSECESGCCFNPEEGLCSLNSPKSSCENSGGEWFDSPSCDISYCQIGCCIIGNQAKESTSKECRELSEKYEIEKDWRPLDSLGTCSAYSNLQKKGACVLESVEYYPEKDCEFTTKESCLGLGGTFNSEYLCTAEELNTICSPSKKTTCVEGRDEVYYLDSCGNLGNIYDANKFNDSEYWTRVISTNNEICSVSESGQENCGNCDYLEGSFCQEYDSNLDSQKPAYGNNICRDLSCDTAWGLKQHGESWCVNDYDFSLGEAKGPVGARSFIATCLDGEVDLEGCADFNQEICLEQTDNNSGFTQGKCFVNDWRSCLQANDEESYSLVEKECEKYEQCVMFNDAYGEDNLKRSDGEWLAGFDPDLLNSKQGAAGDIGEDSNSAIPWCVPKYTPGFQFWNDELTGTNTEDSSDSGSGISYGGSEVESGALCSVGNFQCVSKMKRECELEDESIENPESWLKQALCAQTWGSSELIDKDVDCNPWQDEANWECNIDGVTRTIKTKDLPKWIEAINSRCQAIGTCGSKINIKNSQGYDKGFTITRKKLDATGDIKEINSTNYNLSEEYLSSLGEIGLKESGTLTSLIGTGNVVKSLTGYATIDDTEGAKTDAQAINNLSRTGDASGLDKSMEFLQLGTGAIGMADIGKSAYSSLGGAGFQSFEFSIGEYSTMYFTEDGVVSLFDSGIAESSIEITSEMLGKEGIKAAQDLAMESGLGPVSEEYAVELLNKGEISLNKGTPSTGGSNWATNLKQGLTVAFYTAAGALAGYQIGKMIVKNQDWSSGRSKVFIEGLSSFGSAVGAVAGSLIAFGAPNAWNPLGWAAIIIAIGTSIYTNCIDDEYDENQYYILQFQCEQWEPPTGGDCNACNDDIRPCSEYRCRSLGANCEYNTELGEPGICEDTSEPWKADISPWHEALSEGHEYSDANSKSFKIKNSQNSEGKIDSWENLDFGIETNKPAVCKIDSIRTEDYNEMRYTMSTDENFELGKQDLLRHKITLNAYVGNNSGTSLQLKQNSENTYYIRCKNSKGEINENEFAVRLSVDDGPDLTAPLIKRFSPESESYLKVGTNSTNLRLYVNEPSECKYSIGTDITLYEDMENNMTCITNPNMDVLGEWLCGTELGNLTTGENKFYFKCKDQPNLDSRMESKRNANEKSQEYNINVCSKELEIENLEPKDSEDIIIGGNIVEVDLDVETSGCIDNGVSVCEFSINNGSFIEFLETESKIHKQKLTSIESGKHEIKVRCIDEAGNTANKTTSFEVQVDNSPPEIIRTYKQDENLMIVTDENADCRYSTDNDLKCGFDFTENISETKSLDVLHSIPWNENENYYIKCQDEYGNSEVGCSAEVMTY